MYAVVVKTLDYEYLVFEGFHRKPVCFPSNGINLGYCMFNKDI